MELSGESTIKNWPKRVWYKLTSLILLQLLLLKMTFPTLMSAQMKSLTLVVRTLSVWTTMETTLAHAHRDLHRQRSERPEERISNARVGWFSTSACKLSSSLDVGRAGVVAGQFRNLVNCTSCSKANMNPTLNTHGKLSLSSHENLSLFKCDKGARVRTLGKPDPL